LSRSASARSSGSDGWGTIEQMKLPQSAREPIESGSLAHLLTLNSDGSYRRGRAVVCLGAMR